MFDLIVIDLEGHDLALGRLEVIVEVDGFGGFDDDIELVHAFLEHELGLDVEGDGELFETPEHIARKGDQINLFFD